MALTRHLETYLALERAMLEIEPIDEAAADKLRDLMDPVWYQLSDEDQAWLGKRGEFSDVQALHGLGDLPRVEDVPDPGPRGGIRSCLAPPLAA